MFPLYDIGDKVRVLLKDTPNYDKIGTVWDINREYHYIQFDDHPGNIEELYRCEIEKVN